jgi:anti-sigma-K factor RskA
MLPPGQQYQLWAIAGDDPAPAGLFDVDDVGHAALIVSATVERPQRFAITIEPRGGRPSPTGPSAMASLAPR